MSTCFYFRRIIRSSLDAQGTLPDAAREHVHKCAACRGVYESERAIIRELRDGAGEVDRAPSPFLHGRIMFSVGRSEPVVAGGSKRARAGWAIGVVAACVFALAVIWTHQRAAVTPMAVARALRNAPPGSIDLSLGVKLPDKDQVRQWAGKLDEPLENEGKLVINDAKTALNALANNFLPEKVRHSLFEEGKGS